MPLLSRILILGLVLLFSCTSELFHKQKPRPYYFSNKPASAYPAQAAATSPAASAANRATDSASAPAGEYGALPGLPAAYATRPGLALPAENLQDPNPRADSRIDAKTARPGKTASSLAPSLSKSSNKPLADLGVVGFSAFFVLLAPSLFALFTPSSRGLASWAKNNKKKSWLLIGLGHLVTGFGASVSGRALFHLGHESDELTTVVLSVTAALAVLAYPGRNSIVSRLSWLPDSVRKGRFTPLVLLLSAGMLFFNVANRNEADKHFSPVSTKIYEAMGGYENLVAPVVNTLSASAAPAGTTDWVDEVSILAFVGITILYAFLMYLILVLSCSLACSGMGALAVVVLLGGLTLISFLFILAGKKIVEAGDARDEVRKQRRWGPPGP